MQTVVPTAGSNCNTYTDQRVLFIASDVCLKTVRASKFSGNAECIRWAMANPPYDFRERSFLFACDVVAFSRVVADRGYILGRLATQLVKAGASVGANLEESAGGQTKPDFITKQCIALKEAREARFWLRLIAASEPSLAARAMPLIAEASEFVAMLTAR